MILLLADEDCCFVRCGKTISVFVCLLRIIAGPVYMLVYPVVVLFWLDVWYFFQIA